MYLLARSRAAIMPSDHAPVAEMREQRADRSVEVCHVGEMRDAKDASHRIPEAKRRRRTRSLNRTSTTKKQTPPPSSPDIMDESMFWIQYVYRLRIESSGVQRPYIVLGHGPRSSGLVQLFDTVTSQTCYASIPNIPCNHPGQSLMHHTF